MTNERQKELMDKLMRALAAFMILQEALGNLGYTGLGPNLNGDLQKIKAALFDVARGEEPIWLPFL